MESGLRRLIRVSKLHIVVWGIALLYLVLAPSVYALWFVTDGKPLRASDQTHLPQTLDIRANIDQFLLFNRGGVYQIEGWAFVANQLPVEEYEREVVLASPDGYFAFETRSVRRRDVAVHYELDGLEYGFQALISKYEVPVGTYRLLLSFTVQDQQTVFGDTGSCILRTPNNLLFAKDCFSAFDGKPVRRSTPSALEYSASLIAHIDHFGLSDETGRYGIEGWAFLPEAEFFGDYPRELMLASPTEDMVFEVISVRRSDVVSYFSRGDLELAGFRAILSKNEIPIGTYRLLLSMATQNGRLIYGSSGYCITRTADELVLEIGC